MAKYNADDTATVIRYLLGSGEFSAERNTPMFEHGAALYREIDRARRDGWLTRAERVRQLGKRLDQRGFAGFSFNPSEVYREVFGR